MSNAVEVCSCEDVPPESGRVFLVRGEAVAIWHVAGRFYATAARCPHADGPLVSGSLCGTEITCPMHAWRFDVASGKGLEPADARIETYPTFRKGGRLFVRVD
ncbi:MAG: Rieske 2Fe-2S domain-containing protein [Planctomycetota bacterium]